MSEDTLEIKTLGNPLLEKVKLPGRIFKIPSGGYLYTNGELSPECKDGEIHVRPLSAISEVKLKNPDMLFSGKAIEEVFAECVPEIKKPLELFGRDVDAIMCFLRVVTYGPVFELETEHNCKDGKNHSYNVDLEKIISSIKNLDPTEVGARYKVDLPNGQVVTLEPIRFRHSIELLQNVNKETPTIDDLQRNMVNNLLNMINNIDGITDKVMISEWIKEVPVTYINKIASVMEKANEWGPLFEQEVTCQDCGNKFVVELPINPVSFFSE